MPAVPAKKKTAQPCASPPAERIPLPLPFALADPVRLARGALDEAHRTDLATGGLVVADAAMAEALQREGGGSGAETARVAVDDGDRRMGQFGERPIVPPDQRQVAADGEPAPVERAQRPDEQRQPAREERRRRVRRVEQCQHLRLRRVGPVLGRDGQGARSSSPLARSPSIRPASRSRPDRRTTGPVSAAIRRWPRPTRYSTASRMPRRWSAQTASTGRWLPSSLSSATMGPSNSASAASSP